MVVHLKMEGIYIYLYLYMFVRIHYFFEFVSVTKKTLYWQHWMNLGLVWFVFFYFVARWFNDDFFIQPWNSHETLFFSVESKGETSRSFCFHRLITCPMMTCLLTSRCATFNFSKFLCLTTVHPGSLNSPTLKNDGWKTMTFLFGSQILGYGRCKFQLMVRVGPAWST